MAPRGADSRGRCTNAIGSIVDPLAGSYAIESMTLEIEREARALIEKIDGMGFMQHELGDAAYAAQRALETKSAIVGGVNAFIDEETTMLPILVIDESVARDQIARLSEFRATRTSDWQSALSRLDDDVHRRCGAQRMHDRRNREHAEANIRRAHRAGLLSKAPLVI